MRHILSSVVRGIVCEKEDGDTRGGSSKRLVEGEQDSKRARKQERKQYKGRSVSAGFKGTYQDTRTVVRHLLLCLPLLLGTLPWRPGRAAPLGNPI